MDRSTVVIDWSESSSSQLPPKMPKHHSAFELSSPRESGAEVFKTGSDQTPCTSSNRQKYVSRRRRTIQYRHLQETQEESSPKSQFTENALEAGRRSLKMLSERYSAQNFDGEDGASSPPRRRRRFSDSDHDLSPDRVPFVETQLTPSIFRRLDENDPTPDRTRKVPSRTSQEPHVPTQKISPTASEKEAQVPSEVTTQATNVAVAATEAPKTPQKQLTQIIDKREQDGYKSDDSFWDSD